MNATELANYALAHIGEPKISDIDDTASKAARTCKQFLQATIEETLRLHRWNCAIKRTTLSLLTTAPNHHYDNAFALPSDFLRLLELNGEPAGDSTEFFEIEGRQIVTNDATAEIRYVANIDSSSFDPLLTKAVALALAATIAVPLTSKLELQTQCANLYKMALGSARQTDAIEVGTREGRPMERLISQSRLVNSRFNSHSPRSRYTEN